MTDLNYFAISAALGGTIGPRVRSSLAPSNYKSLARELRDVLRRRGPHVEDLLDVGSSDSRYLRRVKRAFAAARDGYSADRVVADPRLNRSFLRYCEEFGIDDDAFRINKTLLMMRKNGMLSGFKTKREQVTGQWRYAVASELAARSMYLRYGLSVDSLLCSPKRAKEFDHLAASLVVGYSVFEYRWAALNVRKKGASVPDQWRRLPKDAVWSQPVRFDNTERIPSVRGVYSLQEHSTLLYVAATENLRESAESQLRLADVKLIERDLWTPNPNRLFWRFAPLTDVPSSATHGIVNEIIGKTLPVFNIPRGHARRPHGEGYGRRRRAA